MLTTLNTKRDRGEIVRSSRENAVKNISQALIDIEESFEATSDKLMEERLLKAVESFSKATSEIKLLAEDLVSRMSTNEENSEVAIDEVFEYIESIKTSVDDLESASEENRRVISREMSAIKKYAKALFDVSTSQVKLSEKELALVPSLIENRVSGLKSYISEEIEKSRSKSATKKEFEDIWGKLTDFKDLAAKHYKDGNWGGGSTNVQISQNGAIKGMSSGLNFKDSSTVLVAVSVNQSLGIDVSFSAAAGSAFPSMTTAQRLAISPVNGQTAYDTTLKVAMIYVNGNWGTVLLN